MQNQIHVAQIMSDHLIVAGYSNTYSQILEFFIKYHIQHIPVTHEGKLVGIISTNDLLKFIGTESASGKSLDLASLDASFKVEEKMTPHPVSVGKFDMVSTVIEILAEGKFQAVPVVHEEEIIGIITNKDIVRYMQFLQKED